MKNKVITLLFVGILLISINFASPNSVYNWRYQGPSNEPSTSYYSGSWNKNNGNSGYSPGYVPISQKLKTFNGPYTQVHVKNTAPYPRPSSEPSPISNNFQAGGGYIPSSYFGGYGYYGVYYGYSYYPMYYGGYYGGGYYDSYYDSYYPGYYW